LTFEPAVRELWAIDQNFHSLLLPVQPQSIDAFLSIGHPYFWLHHSRWEEWTFRVSEVSSDPLQLQERKQRSLYMLRCNSQRRDSGKGHFWGVWPIEKHWIGIRFWGLGKSVSCTKTDGPILTVNTSWCVFAQGVAVWGRDDCVKFFNRD